MGMCRAEIAIESLENLSSFTLEVKDIDFTIWLSPAKPLSEIKEELYYAFYSYYKEIYRDIAGRPDFCYALEPIGALGGEPLAIKEMLALSAAFYTPPMAGFHGVLADWILDYLSNFGHDIVVRCGDAVAVSFQTEHKMKGPIPVILPVTPCGVGLSENALVLAKNAGFAQAAIAYLQEEWEQGCEIEDLVAEVKPRLGILGGALFYEDTTMMWGCVK